MTEYTKEKCYGGISKMGCDTVVTLTKIIGLAQEKQKGGKDLSEQASDTEIDCVIRLKIIEGLVDKVREDFCDEKDGGERQADS